MKNVELWDLRHFQVRALNLATEAMEDAYNPYSNFYVGACLYTSDDKYITGCNVENASYGLSVCAERVAVFFS